MRPQPSLWYQQLASAGCRIPVNSGRLRVDHTAEMERGIDILLTG
jgi:hypothetical protein